MIAEAPSPSPLVSILVAKRSSWEDVLARYPEHYRGKSLAQVSRIRDVISKALEPGEDVVWITFDPDDARRVLSGS